MDLTKELNCVITQAVQVSPIMKIIRVMPEDWQFPAFEAGQFVALGLPPDAERCPEATKEHAEPKLTNSSSGLIPFPPHRRMM